MPRIDLEQGSDAWLQYRQAHIMATDGSIILGEGFNKTALQLWEEKFGIRKAEPLNDKMKEGQMLEPIAREIACRELEIEFEPCVFESDKYSWMSASLDGISEDNNYLLEIKCGEKSYKQALEDMIPHYYYIQMQHQLLTTGADLCFYFCYRPEHKERPYIIMEVKPNKIMFERLIKEEQAFWISMCTIQPPLPWMFQSKQQVPCHLLV